ncbi:sensor histidine kinase [Cryptosporangium sp. NPDC051539]|uniref:sensor histidine kinase n=1 Tax=Cryptosporangium sp. NPDC051539 TaxID=3363962 RepID=UPI0037AB0825
MIGVLRTSAAAPLAPPDETLATLAGRVRSAGLVLDFSSDEGEPDDRAGDRPGGGTGLPRLADRALYRVVQEALTNAARHAPGAPVRVRLTHTAAAVTVTVSNPLPAPPDQVPGGGPGPETGPGPRPEPGSGLLGLAERVRLTGGSLATGDSGGVFTLTATIPRAAGAAVAEPPRPPGADCSYYGTSAALFPSVRDVYRVCFAGGRVAGVDLIPGRTARGGRG